jgi:hypothetical protein
VKVLAPQHPAWQDKEPFASLLKGDVKGALAGGIEFMCPWAERVYGVPPEQVGTTWYVPPVTSGVQAQPVYNPAVGWAYGFGPGLTTAALVDAWGAVP